MKGNEEKKEIELTEEEIRNTFLINNQYFNNTANL